MGIALGSAVKTAEALNADNRIMNTAGRAAKNLNYIPEASIIMGIPLSSYGKNPTSTAPRMVPGERFELS